MRGLWKEEDYAFLAMSEKITKETEEGARALEDNWKDKKEERVRVMVESALNITNPTKLKTLFI